MFKNGLLSTGVAALLLAAITFSAVIAEGQSKIIFIFLSGFVSALLLAHIALDYKNRKRK